MKGYEIRFNIYAESEQEAKEAQDAIIAFINQHAQQGRAVTGKKITEAVKSWEKNIFIKNQIINFFK